MIHRCSKSFISGTNSCDHSKPYPISCAMFTLERRVPVDKKLRPCMKIQPLNLTSPPLNFRVTMSIQTADSAHFSCKPKEYALLAKCFYAVIEEMYHSCLSRTRYSKFCRFFFLPVFPAGWTPNKITIKDQSLQVTVDPFICHSLTFVQSVTLSTGWFLCTLQLLQENSCQVLSTCLLSFGRK